MAIPQMRRQGLDQLRYLVTFVDELWILDLDGEFAILDAMYRPDTPPDLVEEMRAIAESATFEVP